MINDTLRVLRRVVVATLSTALVLLGTSFVLAPAAHADCLMIGHADLGAAPALLHNPASQGDCNGYFRMFGYLQDKSADNRTAKLYVEGIRSDGYILWTRTATASGYGKSTHFDWTNARGPPRLRLRLGGEHVRNQHALLHHLHGRPE